MKPFHQGKLDVFCAMYAVLNGLRLTHQLRTLQARDILHETLLALAPNIEAFRAVLEQRTDYVALVDRMLNIQTLRMPLRVERPFVEASGAHTPTPENVWEHMETWLRGGQGRAVVFRFLRYRAPDEPPVNRHWTTAQRMEDDTLHFFDCSHEREAVYSITSTGFVTRPEHIHRDCLLCFEPHTLRCLGPRL